jgi:hypothetical protein
VAASPLAAHAQGGLSQEGALFLLVPVGARAVSMGQAVAASDLGSEAIWWNPASLARMTRAEAAVNHSVTLADITGDAVDVVLPAGRAGVLAAAAYLFNPGAQPITDQYGTTVGMLYPRSIVAAASYAATFGSRVSAGVTYKYIQEALGCSGSCTLPSSPVSTSAFDFGVQAIVDDPRRLTVALAVRNLGFPLQVIDAPQADPLPTRVHLGALYTLPSIERLVPDGVLRVSAELVDKLAIGDPSLHVGGEFAYKGQVFLRAGLVNKGSGVEGRTAIGLGVQRGGISMDFARAFGGIASDQGTPPTYVTLRFRF